MPKIASLVIECLDGSTINVDASDTVTNRHGARLGLVGVLTELSEADGFVDVTTSWQKFSDAPEWSTEEFVIEEETPATLRVFARGVVSIGVIYDASDAAEVH